MVSIKLKKLLLLVGLFGLISNSYAQTSGGGPWANHQLTVTDTTTTGYPYKLQFTTGSLYCFSGVCYVTTGVTADSPLSGSGTSGSHLVISTAGTWAGNAATATTAGTVTTAAQTAITSVGTLSSLTMGGTITGKNSGYVDYSSITCGNSVTAGTAVGTGTTPSYTAPTAGKIISATITGSLSAGNCSCVIDVWKTNATLPTVTNTITGGAYPTLSTQTYATTTLTLWSTGVNIAANDVIMCNVNSCTCDNWNVVLGVQK